MNTSTFPEKPSNRVSYILCWSVRVSASKRFKPGRKEKLFSDREIQIHLLMNKKLQKTPTLYETGFKEMIAEPEINLLTIQASSQSKSWVYLVY